MSGVLKLHFSGLNRMPEGAWKAYKGARMCSEVRWKRARKCSGLGSQSTRNRFFLLQHRNRKVGLLRIRGGIFPGV
jgi:hypothetical protein